MYIKYVPMLLLAATLAGCGDASSPTAGPDPATTAPGADTASTMAPAPAAAIETPAAPADAFLAAIASHCGQAFQGRIIANEPQPDGDPFVGQRLVMHVRECSEEEVRVPFHVGEDNSRTWILTRTDTGLRLKHDHRHEDGSDDDVTMYGGDTDAAGTAQRQSFPVDEFSIEMFLREGLTPSVSNVWAMEIEPGERFLYELSRTAENRLFQVEFDLTTPVDRPPTPWGHSPLAGDGESDVN